MAEIKLLKNAYYNPTHPSSFGGVGRLRRGVQDETGEKVAIKKVQDFLTEQDAYTLHKPVRINFPRNRVFVTRPLKQFQSDLCDMKNLTKQNDGYNYLLTVIDIFSKRAYVRPLKRKTAAEVVRAFESVFKDSQIPKKLQTDAGTEFFNKNFKALMKKYGIVHFATASETKASVVERFNRTLKARMWRYFTANNTHRYIDVLQDLVRSYNHSYHSSIKMTPMEVNEKNAFQVFQNLYGTSNSYCKPSSSKFKEGDLVRVSRVRGMFEKRYEQSFTDEVFTVTQKIPRSPPVYKLKDFDNEPIEGSFYAHELQLVKLCKDKLYQVEKILKRRTVEGVKQVFVRWKNWPEKFNSWIRQDALKDI